MKDEEPSLPDELVGQFGRLFGDVFGSRDCADVRVEVCVPAREARAGLRRSITFVRRAICSACCGTGRDPASPACARCAGKRQITARSDADTFTTRTCSACSGHGHDERFDCATCERGFLGVDDTAELVFPPDADTGTVVRVEGKGHTRTGNDDRGDLYVVLTIDESRASTDNADTAYRGSSPRASVAPMAPRVNATSPSPWTLPRIVFIVAAIAFVTFLASVYLVR